MDKENSSVQISVKFEYDLLQDLKSEAEKKGLPYQTFMKQIVRDYLDKEPENEIKHIKDRLSVLERKLEKTRL